MNQTHHDHRRQRDSRARRCCSCTIDDCCLIMGAIVRSGAHIGSQSIIAAGTLIVGE
jgi:acetyltransferase-like isoleucine patch superfamily enzyme